MDEIPLSEIKVTRPCKLCYLGLKSLEQVDTIWLVSPTGIVHHATDYGTTACGKDATGPNWWWRL